MRPLLAAVEVIIVIDPSGAPVTRLRDGERVALRHVDVPRPLDRALALMNGTRSPRDIVDLGRRAGHALTEEGVEQLVAELEAAAMLEGPTRRERRRLLVEEFERAEVRAATFAGGAYHGERAELLRFVQDECIAAVTVPALAGEVRGLVAPHMDLWRAALGYGHAYGALAGALPTDVDTFVVLGTCHVGLRTPFAFSKKVFDTPLGPMRSDRALAERVGARARQDVFAEEYKHKGEHSIEFQVVFLRHVLGERASEVAIVPVLCGLGRSQVAGEDPAGDRDTEAVIEALKGELQGRRFVVVAGADLAHVGPRFGDAKPLDVAGRARLRERDKASLDRLRRHDAPGFFEDVTRDQATRRVCGSGPLYTMLRLLEGASVGDGELLTYTQHVDPHEGSIVSHASMAFCSE
jgi:AmmeMemoRadiSam system protein B